MPYATVPSEMRIEINPEHPEPRKIARAVQALRAGEVIAYPTDTVYGLGCAISEKRAIESLYTMKQMPRTQPLALVVADLSGIARFAVVQDFHYRFIKHLVPGPYVFILEATRDVPKLLMMKRKTIGIRVPEHPVARERLGLRPGRAEERRHAEGEPHRASHETPAITPRGRARIVGSRGAATRSPHRRQGSSLGCTAGRPHRPGIPPDAAGETRFTRAEETPTP